MRISELSARTGVRVPTLKYYLREGLLHAGRATAANQADYDEGHLRRVTLIRTLLEVGGLGIAQARAVVEALEDENLPLHDLLGVAHHALGPPARAPESDDLRRARADVDAFLEELGWRASETAPARDALARALLALRRLGREGDVHVFMPYAQAAREIASWELDHTQAAAHGSAADAVENVVVGTVVFEAALGALRRLAQEHESALRFAAG